ncbi:MAG: flavodoxin family protein [Candidatus Brocadiia bacterium]
MNIVTVIGSPHGMKGNTGQLLSRVEESIKASGAEVTQFDVTRMDVKPCRGCGSCHKTGQCVIKDDFKKIEEAFMKADGIVLASPNYIFSVSAQMKALLDRCSCPIHCQALEGKYGAAVVTSGGSGSDVVEGYILHFLRALGCWTVGSVAAEAAEVEGKSGRGARFGEAGDLGNRMVAAIRESQTFADQESERAAFFGRMKALISMHKEDWPHEYRYWKSLGRI